MTRAPLPAVLFDAADTLLELTPAFPELLSTSWLGAEGAPSAQDVREALWAIGAEGHWPDDEADPAARLTMWTEFFQEALRRAGGADSHPAALRAARYALDPANYRLYPDVLPCLDALRAAGHQLALVSNFDGWLREILAAHRLTDRFDEIVISSEVGFEKPRPEIFDLTCRRLRRPPGDCVFIGDSLVVDVDGARDAGMHPLLIDRYARFPDHPGPRITSLLTLVDLVAHLPLALPEDAR
ncbi:HAD family hydrolase [Streptomyces xanthophaeus]|uniref:HAD family hydrolase n=1 Tax=Streptomyces xanthophaeus TaxID=67385 RepID=UPI003715D388